MHSGGLSNFKDLVLRKIRNLGNSINSRVLKYLARLLVLSKSAIILHTNQSNS